MRLDIVQAALPIEGFSISRSRVMMCSLNGLAFRPGEGFAFTAEQMTGRYLIDAERRLNVRQIGDFIAESDNWGALKTWLSMANSEQEGRVCIFEYDSYFADEQGCRRLFRGHPVQSGISGRSPLAMSSAVAKRLLDCLQEDGSLKAPFPEWQSGRGEGGEFVSSQAELAIALARLAEMSGEQEFLLASKKIIKALLKNCRSSADKLMRFVLEEEELAPDERQQDPRLMLNVQGNALLCLALMETGLLAEEQYAQACREIMMYVSRQQLRSGDFIHSLVYPDMRGPLEEAYSEESRTEAVALVQANPYSRYPVTGDGFLYHMVRILLGTLVLAGQGKLAPRKIPGIIKSGDRTLAGPTMAPQGLLLERLYFADTLFGRDAWPYPDPRREEKKEHLYP